MAEGLKCTWCGHENPPDAEVCERCGSRLTPVWAASSGASEAGDEVPDWLFEEGKTQAPEPAAGESQPEDLASGDLPDWLFETTEPEAQGPATETDEDATQAAETVAAPDWLLGEGPAPEAPAPEAEEAAAAGPEPGEIPDWLLGAEPAPEAPAPEAEDAAAVGPEPAEIPDWLLGAAPEATVSEAEETPAAGPEPGEVPDWLLGAEPAPEAPAPEAEEAAAAGPEPGEVPDWLLGEGPGAEAPTTEAEEAPAAGSESGEVPDWLFGEPAAPEATAPEAEEAAAAGPEPEVPDWLLGEGPASEAPTTEAEEAPAAGPEPGEIPDWLLGETAAPEAPAPEAGEAAAAGPEPGEIPDWLLGEGPGAEAPTTEAEEAPAAGSEPGEIPDWLLGEGPASEAPVAEGEAPAEAPEETPAEAPAVAEEAAAPRLEEESGVLLDESEWEALFQAVSQQEQEAPAEQAGEEAPETVELPDWLRELQQAAPAESESETALLEEEKAPVPELAGPLVGIPDVLPPEPRVFEMVEPVRPVLKLLLRPEEREWARRFRALLQAEMRDTTTDIEVERAAPYLWWRLAVGTVLLLLLGFVLFLGGPGPADPEPAPPLLGFVAAVQELPPQSYVMVAVDYDPAWDVELRWPAHLALAYLESRQPNYVVLSTLPYGPDMARDLFREAGIPQERVHMLGYLPGGRLGLALLAQAPSRAFPYRALPPGWARVQDGRFLLVMTENPVRARDWIEQIGPVLPEGTALAFVLSTQTAPALLPYFDAPVRGWVAGAADAAVLSRYVTVPQTPLARTWAVTAWNGMAAGLVLALLAAIAGRLWQARRSRSR